MGKKLKYETVSKAFADQGCVLLEKDYRDVDTPMSYLCKCGRKSRINFSNFKVGKRCKWCRNEILSKQRRLDYDYVKDFVESNGYTLVSGEYINNRIKLSMRCPKGHETKITFWHFKEGKGCKTCGVERRAGENHYNYCTDREKLKLNSVFRDKCRHALHLVLKAIHIDKDTESSILNGYKYTKLKSYILDHPNWDMVKNESWHLDHIFPIKAFMDYGLTKAEHIKTINGLDNLQPLTKLENCSKRDKYNKFDFEKWLTNKGINFETKKDHYFISGLF